MLTRVLLLSGVAVLTAILASCIFDPEPAPPTPPPPQQNYKPLDKRENVLNNLEVSYNRRHINKYNEVLDQNFTMFFSEGDVSDGRTPEQWGRADGVGANSNLFDPNYTDTDPSDGIQPRCIKITMDVKWEDGVVWQEIQPASAPGETWYMATVFYNFQFDVEPDLHLINNPASKAQFTVRNAGTEDEPHWQLVELRDLDGAV
jgi:hypothetical protein